jgi:hypothetical protein
MYLRPLPFPAPPRPVAILDLRVSPRPLSNPFLLRTARPSEWQRSDPSVRALSFGYTPGLNNPALIHALRGIGRHATSVRQPHLPT